MQTVTQSTIRAKYAIVYDEPCTIIKAHDVLYVLFEDSRMERFAIEIAPFMVVLGDVVLSETQAMRDRIAGGFAAIACSREMGVH